MASVTNILKIQICEKLIENVVHQYSGEKRFKILFHNFQFGETLLKSFFTGICRILSSKRFSPKISLSMLVKTPGVGRWYSCCQRVANDDADLVAALPSLVVILLREEGNVPTGNRKEK